MAGNQRGFARAVKESGIPRDQMFICGSVLSNRAQGYDAAKKKSARGCEENMEAFAAGGIDYLDMIMVCHAPLGPAFYSPFLFTLLGAAAAHAATIRIGSTRKIAILLSHHFVFIHIF